MGKYVAPQVASGTRIVIYHPQAWNVCFLAPAHLGELGRYGTFARRTGLGSYATGLHDRLGDR